MKKNKSEKQLTPAEEISKVFPKKVSTKKLKKNGNKKQKLK